MTFNMRGANPFARETAELSSLDLFGLAHANRDACKPDQHQAGGRQALGQGHASFTRAWCKPYANVKGVKGAEESSEMK